MQIDDGDPKEAREVESIEEALDGKLRGLDDTDSAMLGPCLATVLLPMLPGSRGATSRNLSIAKASRRRLVSSVVQRLRVGGPSLS